MPLLAFETSCDETSAAVVSNGRVLSSIVSSQVKLHAEYGGVVPELAAREHIRNLLPVATEALREAECPIGEVSALAATAGPGLPSALMVGLKAAQALAFSLRKPFVALHHHEAHLYSPWISGSPPRAHFEDFEPNVSLIVSGGHTMLVHVTDTQTHLVLGGTLDDAAGECFDKVGKLLGLPYPAGPEVDRLAKKGKADAFDFPRPMLTDSGHDFSFSGLKTSIRYFVRDRPGLLDDSQALCDLCASVQAAIVEVLVAKTIRAARQRSVGCITASGGVTCNSALRRALSLEAAHQGFRLHIAEPRFCTDNAAMIGVLAEHRLGCGVEGSSLDEDIRPSWPLE